MKKLFSCRLSEGALREVGRVRESMGLKSDGAVIEEWARVSYRMTAGPQPCVISLTVEQARMLEANPDCKIETTVPTTIFAPMKVEPSLADERASREPIGKPSGAIV